MKKIIYLQIILLIIISYNVFSQVPIVSYEVTKQDGGLTGLFNRYDDVYSHVWTDEAGKHVRLFCEHPGFARCKRAGNVYYNPNTGDLLGDEISTLIDDKIELLIENSEQQFLEDLLNRGSSGDLIAVTENGIIIYYISFVCAWSYQMHDDDSFDGSVSVIAYYLYPEEL